MFPPRRSHPLNHRRSFWLHLAVSLVLAGCASIVCAASDSSRAMPPVSVVLISMDGTRPSALTEQNLPSLVDLGRRGARAEALIPVDPSNTFPSHVSLATGVRPDVHRLVNNSFIDPERGRFRRDEPHAWIEAEPIWSIAERHGLRTASFYWVGSEGPWQGGPGPSETRKFSSRTSEKRKVDQILEWLAIGDPALRPRLIMSWFHGADHEGHLRGPDSDSLGSALAPQQAAIAPPAPRSACSAAAGSPRSSSTRPRRRKPRSRGWSRSLGRLGSQPGPVRAPRRIGMSAIPVSGTSSCALPSEPRS